MEEIKIVKESLTKDEYQVSVEVTNANAKFEPQITIKLRGDRPLSEIMKEAIKEYKNGLGDIKK